MSFRTFLSRSRTVCRAPTSQSGRNAVSRVPPRCGHAYTTAAEGRTGARTIRVSYALAAAVLLGTSSYVAGVISPPAVFQMLNPRPAPAPPAVDSEEGRMHTEQIERELQSLKMIKGCRAAEDAEEWYETRPYTQMPLERLVNNFTAGALRGPGKLAVPPLVRAKKDETEAWVFIHLGRGVCGHDGIVHGGLLATLLDEGCARNAVLNFPSHVAVTANLNLDYKAPTRADQFVVMKTKLVELKGRKAVVEGRIEDMDGNVLAQARTIFVEPKFANALSAGALQAIFPSARERVAKMTGTRGQVADEGAVKGQ